MIFKDRRHAGELLAKELAPVIEANHSKVLILALPRGGVPVAAVLAEKLSLPMNILAVRKVGAPFNREYAIGAICEDGEAILNEKFIHLYAFRDADLDELVNRERKEMARQIGEFRQGQKLTGLSGKTIIIVDDGIATGATVCAGIKYLKSKNVNRILVATPILSTSAYLKIKPRVEKIVAVENVEDLNSVGEWYENFTQVTDEEVKNDLAQSQQIANKEKVMATQQKTDSQKNTARNQVLDTAGGEMPNPKAPGHGPTEDEAKEVFASQRSNRGPQEKIPEAQGDLADQAEKETENEVKTGIDKARSDLHH